MRDAVTEGPAERSQAEIADRYIAEFGDHNGYLLGDIGHYGTDYTLRALTDKVGVGALKPKVAIYAFTQTAQRPEPADRRRALRPAHARRSASGPGAGSSGR